MRVIYFFLVLIVLHCLSVYGNDSHIISVDIITEDNNLYYVGTFSVGFPPSRLRLSFSFWEKDIILFKRVDQISATYSSDRDTSSDIFRIAGNRYRFPFVIDITKTPYSCPSCDGICGLAYGSPLWKVWREMTFSPSMIHLGDISDIFKTYTKSCDLAAVQCSGDGFDRYSLCSVDAEVSIGRHIIGNYNVSFTLDPYTYLPDDLYGRFLRGKNIYSGGWDPLNIDIDAILPTPNWLESEYRLYVVNNSKCHKTFSLSLDRHDFTDTESKWYDRKLKILPFSQTRDIVLGIDAWKKFVVHKSLLRNSMVVKPHETRQHASTTALILFCTLSWLLVRWKTSDINCIDDRDQRKRAFIIDILYQLAAIAISWVCPFLPFVSQVLQSDVYLLLSLLLIHAVLTLGALVCVIHNYLYATGKTKIIANGARHIEYLVFKRVSIETLVCQGMLFLTLEGRTEGISAVTIFFVSAFIIWNLVLCASISFFILVSYGEKVSSRFLVLAFGIIPILIIYYVFICCSYIALPIMRRTLSILVPQISYDLVIIMILVIFVVAFYMVRLYFSMLAACNKKE